MEKLPVVKLTEKSLRRLKEKIEKLHLDKNTTDDDIKKSSSKTPKFEVYRPGVSRLSNRVSSDGSNILKKGSRSTDAMQKNFKSSKSKQRNENHQKQTRFNSKRGRPSNNRKQVDHVSSRTFTARDTHSSGDSYDEEEEGFLARHERRRRRRGYSTSSYDDSDHEMKKEHNSDDEFIWDDYHGDFLNDEFSISTTSDEVGLSNSTESPSNQYLRTHKEDLEGSQDQPRSKKKHSSGDSPILSHQREDEGSKPDRGLLIRTSENTTPATPNDSRKALFNPDNPDIPIMVRPNLRDKKIKAKSTAASDKRESESRQVRSPLTSAGPDNSFLSSDPASYDSITPAIPSKYTSQANHWNASVGIDLSELEPDRNADSHDVLSSGILDRDSEKSCEKLFKEAENLEITINNLLSPRHFSLKSFNEKLQISRTELKQIYKSLILHHIEVASKQNVEQMLWKTVYHQPLEQLRKQIASSDGDEKKDLKNLLVVVLDQASEFYENLLMRLQQMYKINLKELLSNVSAFKQLQKRIGKRTKLALMSCQRSLICLGDISRYKENANETSNYGRARQFYIQARTLEPRNGRPYNQLALLAVHTRRKLDAIYYYARSLATVGTPILTARESLIALFDDARRKYQKSANSSNRTNASLLELSEHSKIESTTTKKRTVTSPRMIWIRPDQDELEPSAEAEHDVSENDDKSTHDQSTTEMTPTQLLRHFVLVFTHVHGKLFTRVGLDSFEKLKDELLELFSKVLSEGKILISKQTLLHVFSVNFFSVFDQKQKQNDDSSASSWLLLQALQLALSMIAILTRHVTAKLSLLPTQPGQVYDPLLSPQLPVLLPSLKVACDWLYSNKSLWYPDPPARPSDSLHDVWASLAELCDWLIGDFKKFPMRIYNQNVYNLEEVCLPEDSEFSGFSPLSSFEYESRYVLISEYTSPEQRDRAAECVRLDLVRDFLEYLCGMEEPLLAFKEGRYVVLFENDVTTEETKPRLSSTDEFTDFIKKYDQKLGCLLRRMEKKVVKCLSHDVIIKIGVDRGCILSGRSHLLDRAARSFETQLLQNDNQSSDNDDDDVMKNDEDFTELRALRDSLQRTKDDHDKRKDQIIASLEESADSDSIRVKPNHLIPDTNCFIDHLDYIEALISSGVYIIFVPLVVIVELQGLAQDSKSDNDHAVKVYNNASTAVDFLKRKFSTERDSKIQALTNQGSILHTISFQTQSDVGSKATNDDLILQCCVKHENKLKSQDNVRTVLLTDDRNLRVKALARNMPTKSLPDFCKWASC